MKSRVAVGIMLLFTVGFAAFNLLAYNHARAMLQFTTGGARTIQPEALGAWQKVRVLLSGVRIPRPESDLPLSALADDAVPLRIHVGEYISLEAWYCDRGESTPLVILFHGYASDKSALLVEAQAFLDLGTSVLLVDFRGSGGSSDTYTTVGFLEAHDVSAAIRFASESLAHQGVVLFGQSMGAVAILRAIRHHGITPDAIILEAVFDTMLNTVRNRFAAMRVPSFPGAQVLMFWGGRQWNFNAFEHNPLDYAAVVEVPALFLHGENDPRARLQEGRRCSRLSPARSGG
jgi:uncharacterized protein